MTWRHFALYAAGISLAPVVGFAAGAIIVRIVTGRW